MHPSAATSAREGLDETLQGLGITGALYRTLRTSNPIENLNGSIADYTHNVKRWRDRQMVLRLVASAICEARERYRALRGFRDMPKLIGALQSRIPTSDVQQLKVAWDPKLGAVTVGPFNNLWDIAAHRPSQQG